MSRTETIRALLSSQRLTTQAALVRALTEAGHSVNQATVSRELKRLGVEKIDGVYCLPRPRTGAPVHRFTARRFSRNMNNSTAKANTSSSSDIRCAVA